VHDLTAPLTRSTNYDLTPYTIHEFTT
jgi:hypothetical protein